MKFSAAVFVDMLHTSRRRHRHGEETNRVAGQVEQGTEAEGKKRRRKQTRGNRHKARD